jgi:hypothetical protein
VEKSKVVTHKTTNFFVLSLIKPSGIFRFWGSRRPGIKGDAMLL